MKALRRLNFKEFMAKLAFHQAPRKELMSQDFEDAVLSAIVNALNRFSEKTLLERTHSLLKNEEQMVIC